MKSGELIHRYFIGVASAEEVRELERRLQGDKTIQDEYLLQAEIDAHLRQKVEASLMEDGTAKLAASPRERPVWKWVSGISTLAATLLLALMTVSVPRQPTATGYPSLGRLTAVVSRTGYGIWAAAATDDLPMIRAEWKRGVAVDARDEDGVTALHVAALTGHARAAELLLSFNADVTLTDQAGNSALHMAVFLGRRDVVGVLLANGADPLARNDAGFCSVDIAAAPWSEHYAEHVREAESKMGIPLDMGRIRRERSEILNRLVGRDHARPPSSLPSSLLVAATTGNVQAIQEHLAIGSDLNQTEPVAGNTPLMLAVVFGNREAVRLLIEAGADINIRSKSGSTALHLACFHGRPEIAKWLLDSGADRTTKNTYGATPIDLAPQSLDAKWRAVYEHNYQTLNLELDFRALADAHARIRDLFETRSTKWGGEK